MRRLLQFRDELTILWHAFFAPDTPLYLKGLMLLIPAYLLSPFDLIPDFIPVLGWVDDAIIIPLLVSLIIGLLRRHSAGAARRAGGDAVIDGTYRRL